MRLVTLKPAVGLQPNVMGMKVNGASDEAAGRIWDGCEVNRQVAPLGERRSGAAENAVWQERLRSSPRECAGQICLCFTTRSVAFGLERLGLAQQKSP